MSSIHSNGKPEGPGRGINQFGDYEDVTRMTVDDWADRWKREHTKFHVPFVHPMLQKHIDVISGGRPHQRIFLPLCGKSLDLKWLSEQGHVVVGNEAVDMACVTFFEEHNIPYTTEPIKGVDGVIYKATEENHIEIYRCDFFELTSDIIGTFDAIWDRGSFPAISVPQRRSYAKCIRGLMKNDCKYLLDTFLVDNTHFQGPPFNCTEEEIMTHFDGCCKVIKLSERDVFSQWQKEMWGVDSFVEQIHQLLPI